jgi:CheY-like chemotaxis protein
MMMQQILLVDDNPIQGATRSAILSRSGARVLVCSRAKDALALLETPETLASIGMMVTDHLMPEMNGPELVRRVRDILPALPILVLSGLPEAEPEYAALGVSFHLKPFPPEQLIRVTRALLNEPELRTA